MLSFRSFLNMLLEDRIDFLKQKHADPASINSDHDAYAQHRDAHAIIDHFATHADPSPKKQFTQWIVNRYHKGNFRQEDAGRIHAALSGFAQHQKKLTHKDINQYKGLHDLESAVEPHLGTLSGKQEKKLVKSEGADLVHENEHSMVHRLKTKEASCKYGAGTKWCTAARDNNNMFDHYNKEGPLYVIQSKHPDESGEHRKFQFHPASGQFMDEKDEEVDAHHIAHKYGLQGAPELEHTHVAFMHPHNLKKPEYLLKHQEAIARTGKDEHINALLDAAK